MEKQAQMEVLGVYGDQELIGHNPKGEAAKKIGSSFFRGENCNFYPNEKEHAAGDFLERFLLKGWLPKEGPSISKETKVTAFGSCFAENITKHLRRIGYSTTKDRAPDIYLSSVGEGLVNVHSLLGQLEWALEGVTPPDGLWHGHKAESYGLDETVRERTRETLLNTEFFIITLGLSEVWYDEQTGGVFWRAVPIESFDPNRHKFRVCTMAETKAALQRIHGLIRQHVPKAKLLFTLSPVSLAATFRPVGCISANSASKAILRAALDEMLRDAGPLVNDSLFYWPSYEIVTDLFAFRFGRDGRHPQAPILYFVMRLFEAIHCASGVTMGEVSALYRQTRLMNASSATKGVPLIEEEAPMTSPEKPANIKSLRQQIAQLSKEARPLIDRIQELKKELRELKGGEKTKQSFNAADV